MSTSPAASRPSPTSAPARGPRRSLGDLLRLEVAGGLTLLVAATLALVLANSPLADDYTSLRDTYLGVELPGSWTLRMTVGHWASDALLAVFFFVAGTELKRELVTGELRNPAKAALPIMAAVGGMVVPALVYLVVATAGGGGSEGWAVPMATDIAFALGVLAVVGRGLPTALRTFLLTLAIVDDLIAIMVIAVFFASGLNFVALGLAVAGLVLFWYLHRSGVRGWWVYVPLGVVVWALVLNSGVHATIAGVALGMLLRATPREGEEHTPAERVADLLQPWSAGLAVPLFALFAAGVPVSAATLTGLADRPEALGVATGLVVGKFVGILGASFLMVTFTKARLSASLRWADLAGAALLAGIGFTVSLLIADLAFTDRELAEQAKAAVLLASLTAGVLATVVLRLRAAARRRAEDDGGAESGARPADAAPGSGGGRAPANNTPGSAADGQAADGSGGRAPEERPAD